MTATVIVVKFKTELDGEMVVLSIIMWETIPSRMAEKGSVRVHQYLPFPIGCDRLAGPVAVAEYKGVQIMLEVMSEVHVSHSSVQLHPPDNPATLTRIFFPSRRSR
jgi:hypothetical protein